MFWKLSLILQGSCSSSSGSHWTRNPLVVSGTCMKDKGNKRDNSFLRVASEIYFKKLSEAKRKIHQIQIVRQNDQKDKSEDLNFSNYRQLTKYLTKFQTRNFDWILVELSPVFPVAFISCSPVEVVNDCSSRVPEEWRCVSGLYSLVKSFSLSMLLYEYVRALERK